jgi:PAS domain S-box-containing protein
MKRPRIPKLALRVSLAPILAVIPGTALIVLAYGANWPGGVVVGCLGVAMLAMIATWLSVDAMVVRPLHMILRVIDRLTEGDFAARTDVRRGDELSVVLRALDDLAGKIESSLAATRAAERRYRLLFEHNPAGVFRTRAEDGRILDCNIAAVKILGYASVLEAKTYRAEAAYADPADRKILVDRLRREPALTNVEVRFRRKDGREIAVLLNLCRLDEPDGAYLVGQFVDISDRKRLEAADDEIIALQRGIAPKALAPVTAA